jgi:hypothetical protein
MKIKTLIWWIVPIAIIAFFWYNLESYEYTETGTLIGKSVVGDKYGNIKHYLAYRYSDGRIETREVSPAAYYTRKDGVTYVFNRSSIRWKK